MTKMKKTKGTIIYPAIFEEENEQYNIIFPDFNNSATWGENLENAIFMARDLLGGLIIDYEESKRELPNRTDIKKIKTNENKSFTTYIDIDIEKYKRSLIKSVKKTVYISNDLNEEAENLGLNFSQILRDALRQQLKK